jgi:hypothetical protein
MIARWRRRGVLGLEHGLIGRAASNRTADEVRERVIALMRGKYAGFNLKHLHEQLTETEKIPGVSYTSIKRLARQAGIARVRARRRTRIRKRRARFSQAGYMLQMDGSRHFWWQGKQCCLIAGIDDATSDVPYGEFFETETLEGYMRVLRRIIELKGVPRVLYVDRASWLGGLDGEEAGQFERMCTELGIRVIRAHSAEAKGRIERLWGTLQDRLCSEFRLHGIETLQQATTYLNQRFLPTTWQRKFIVKAEGPGQLYRPRPTAQALDQVFCLKFSRKIRKDHTLLFGNELYAITARLRHPLARCYAEIRVSDDGKIRGYSGGQDLALRLERKRCWERGEKPKPPPGISLWKRVLGTELPLHTPS